MSNVWKGYLFANPVTYVNDIKSVISHSYLKMFADDLTLYRNIASVSDCELLQWDLRRIYEWTLTWLLRLNPLKCEALNITNKRCPLHFNYYIGSHLISWVQKVKYLGVFVTSKLNWSDHCKYCVHKATVCLNHLRRIMFGASFSAKNIAYKCLVRPHLEYACPVWSPFTSSNIKLIESVQRRAARWICSTWNPRSYQWSKSLDDCISELQWPSLQSRRQFLSLSILYDIWKGRTGITFSDYFEFNTLCTRSHSLTLKVFSSTINAFRYCFFVSVAFLWNTVPEDILARSQVKHFRSRLKQFILM